MNYSSSAINLSGYKLVSVKGNQSYTFGSYVLAPDATVTVYGKDGSGDLQGWASNVWSNSDPDPAELYGSNGVIVDRWDD